MMKTLNVAEVKNLPDNERIRFAELVKVYNYHKLKNEKKEKYYEGAVTLKDVNIGIALPHEFANIQIGCEWGAKTVDVLASRSMFDGFVSQSGDGIDMLKNIMDANNLITEYMKACRDELKFG